MLRWVTVSMLALAILLSGCGAGGGAETTEATPPRHLQRLSITLDGESNAEDAAILMADKLGYFKDVGLKVFISKPLTPVRPIRYMVTGLVDLSVSYEPQVVLAADRGVPIVAIGSLVPEPTLSMIWLKESGIEDIADLKRKTIAYSGLSFQVEFLRALLARAGLTLADVKLRRSDYELVPDLVQGRADAIFGGSWPVEGLELEKRGLDPVITRVQDLGVPAYDELVVVGRPDRLSEDPRLFRDFMSAVVRAVPAVTEDPETVAREIVKLTGKENSELSKAGIEAMAPHYSETGEMDPEQGKALVDWMHEQGMIESGLPVSELLTNDYLEPRP